MASVTRSRKLSSTIAAGAVVLALSACGVASNAQHASYRGISNRENPLLALRETAQREVHGSVSGAFLFAIGAGGGAIDSTTQHYVGFIVEGKGGRVYELHYPSSMVDYRLDPHASRPSVRFYFEQDPNWDGTSSTTENLEDDTIVGYVRVTLTPADFSKDIAVLQYADSGGSSQ